MRSDKTRPAGIALMAIGFLATLVFLAGPAGANPGAPGARDGSVTSGAKAEATGGSTASGCSAAADGSTSSGGVCPSGGGGGGGGGATQPVELTAAVSAAPSAPVATATGAKKMAMTGSSTLPLAAGALVFLLVGGLMVVATSDRRRLGSQAS